MSTIKVSVPAEDIKVEELSLIKYAEQELKEMLRRRLTEKGSLLRIRVQFEIIPRQEGGFKFESNASFSIADSLYYDQLIKEFVANNQELLVSVVNFTLSVITTFDVNHQTSQNQGDDTRAKQNDDNSLTFIPIEPRYSFSQIILPEHIQTEIFDALNVIECKDLIYNIWGFSEVDSVPRSILNFYGEPGTGKTMCAHAIASRLGKKLLALNYAEIESKYVGEAPKNLQRAFDIAKETDSVLFFDEADSFLGKRIENVTQGADQALNSLRSQMLILLENHAGVVLFATNLVTNFDKAFESRILKHIKFELPNKEARIAIIRKMLPRKLPLLSSISDEALLQAAEIAEGFSGREIKTTILNMLLAKAGKEKETARFSEDDLIECFTKSKEQKETLSKEENLRLKNKILKKLEEKNEEARIMNDMENEQKTKEEDSISNNSSEVKEDCDANA